jgi:hypothetical protein
MSREGREGDFVQDVHTRIDDLVEAMSREGREGDRKGPHPAQPRPRLYYDDGSGSPGSFIVEAGEVGMRGGDPCGRLI